MATNTPSLRFIGFDDKWQTQKLADLVDLLRSYPFSRDVEISNKSEFRYIHYGDIHREKLKIIKSENELPYIIENNQLDYLKNGDIVVADVSEDYIGIANPCVIDCDLNDKVIAGLHTIAMRPKLANHLFLYYLFYSNHFKQYGKFIGTGTKVFGITAKNLLKFESSFPNLPEQTTIGNFFRQLDKLINQHEQKYHKLIQFKKAMLSRLFPNTGETTPIMRLKGFTGEWERVKLGDIGEIITGSTPSTSDLDNYSNDGMLWVTPTDIQNVEIFNTAKKLSLKGQKIARIAPMGSILVTCIASIGKNALLSEQGSFNQQINALIPNENYHSYFLFTQSFLWSEQMKKIAGIGTMQILNKQQFSEITTLIPKEKSEQIAIGHFFQELDRTLALSAKHLTALKQLKKALLGEMLG